MKTEPKFETALERLEDIVGSLEDGSLSLDDALKGYEEGVKLARLCTKQLTEAEKKIEILTKSLSGDVKAVPFEQDAASGTAAPKRAKMKSRKRIDSENEDAENDLF